MSEEFINNSYIEMLIQDLEENSLGYWGATQDEMAKSLRNLQQENQKLKEELKIKQDDFKCANDEINQLKEEIKIFQKNSITKECAAQVGKEDLVNMLFASWSRENGLYQQLDLYESVIEKVREYVNNHIHQETFTGYMDSYELKKLLQILDKVKGVK